MNFYRLEPLINVNEFTGEMVEKLARFQRFFNEERICTDNETRMTAQEWFELMDEWYGKSS